VVSDTSPLIYLEKAGQIPLLEKMFGHVLIPESVRNELFGKTPEHEAEARKILKSDCFSVLPVRNTESVRYYMTEMGLHRGESEAITLARECNANVLIMDESAARSVVSEEGLPVYLMGAMGIVRQGYESGLISDKRSPSCRRCLAERSRNIYSRKIPEVPRRLPRTPENNRNQGNRTSGSPEFRGRQSSGFRENQGQRKDKMR